MGRYKKGSRPERQVTIHYTWERFEDPIEREEEKKWQQEIALNRLALYYRRLLAKELAKQKLVH